MRNIILHFGHYDLSKILYKPSIMITNFMEEYTEGVVIDRADKARDLLKEYTKKDADRDVILWVVDSAFSVCQWKEEASQIGKLAKDTILLKYGTMKTSTNFYRQWGLNIEEVWSNSTLVDVSDQFVDWSKLYFKPEIKDYDPPNKIDIEGLTYFGTAEKLMQERYDKYFRKGTPYKKNICYEKKVRQSKFDIDPDTTVREPLTDLRQLTYFQYGIYTETPSELKNPVTLKKDFYMMLSAGVVVLFDKKCQKKLSGLIDKVSKFTVAHPKDVETFLKLNHKKLAREQAKLWDYSFDQDFLDEVEELFYKRENVWKKRCASFDQI